MAATSPAKRRRLDRETTSAYAASQPLFDALRNGVASAGEQRVHLQKARDTVQGLHVKLVDTTNIDDTERHELYMDCAVKAWRNATKAFTNIFEELCKISAADPAEGRKAGAHYEEFEKLAWMARTARKAAAGYQLSTGKGTSSPKPGLMLTQSRPAKNAQDGSARQMPAPAVRERDTPESERLTPQPFRPSASAQTPVPAKRPRTAPSPEPLKAEAERLAKKVEAKSPGPTGLPDARVEKNKRKRLAKRQKRKSSASVNESVDAMGGTHEFGQGNSTPNTAAGSAPTSAGKENTTPGIEYEDVSAEVAARLKAKEEKRKAQKEERKRKRESGGSLADAGLGAAIAERPSKKRMKNDGTGSVAGAGTDNFAKRKQDAGDDAGVKASVKKRKKMVL